MRGDTAAGTATAGGATHPPPSAPAMRRVATPADCNPDDDIFGAWLVMQMDVPTGSAAGCRARGRCATVAVDSMAFLSPVFVGDEWASTPR